MNILKTITLSLCALVVVATLPSCAGKKKVRSTTITLETDNEESIVSKIAKF